MKKLAFLILGLAAFQEGDKNQPHDEAGAILFKKVDPSVVAIQHEKAGGSGFIISADGYILTNGHVVSDADNEDPKAVAKLITVVLSNEKKYKAKVIGLCLDPDVALIKIEPESSLPIVEFADISAVKTGQKSYAIGMPVGHKRTLTGGIISNIANTELGTFTSVIQTDAAINPGNSGGPLFNEQGQVLGLNTYAGGGQNLGFTVPINVALFLKDHYLKYGYFRRATINFFMIQELYDELAQTMGVEKGILIDYVEPNSKAANKGLMSGDILVEMNGSPVSARTSAQLKAFNWQFVTQEIGSTVTFKIKRRKEKLEEHTITVTLDEDEPSPATGWQKGEIKEIRYDDLGLGFRRLVTLAKILNKLPSKRGAWITTVLEKTPAARAGLAANDLVTAINDEPVSGSDDFQVLLEKSLLKRQKAIHLTIQRGNTTVKTALAPFYDLAGTRIAFILPESDFDYFDLVRLFCIANGAQLTFISKNLTEVTSTDGKKVKPDMAISGLKITDFDCLLFAGGKGAKSYWYDGTVAKLVKEAVKQKKVLGAIGAASITLISADSTLLTKKITTDEEFSKDALAKKANYTGKEVETDGNIITTTGFDKKGVKSFLKSLRTALIYK